MGGGKGRIGGRERGRGGEACGGRKQRARPSRATRVAQIRDRASSRGGAFSSFFNESEPVRPTIRPSPSGVGVSIPNPISPAHHCLHPARPAAVERQGAYPPTRTHAPKPAAASSNSPGGPGRPPTRPASPSPLRVSASASGVPTPSAHARSKYLRPKHI